MSELYRIPAGTRRAVWVFAIDLEGDALAAFQKETFGDDDDHVHWPLRDAVGVSHLDHDFIEVFEAEKLADYGFAKYLIEANGMDAESVMPDAEKLDALTGPVLLVFSSALSSNVDRLLPTPPLRLVGRYGEAVNLAMRPILDVESAKGVLDGAPVKSRPSDAAMSGRVAMAALAVLFLLVAVMVWVGG